MKRPGKGKAMSGCRAHRTDDGAISRIPRWPQFVRCLRIALGSAMELRTHLELVQELELSAQPEPVAEALQRCERLIGLIIGLIRSLVARP